MSYGYQDEFGDPMTKVSSTLETIDAGTAASRGDDVRWCRAWRDMIRQIGPSRLWAADKACRRVINSKADDGEKAAARRCLHLIRDGHRLAMRVDEIDLDLSDLYPADVARDRLDHEIGLESQPGETDGERLDRACMKARAANPNSHVVKVNAFAYCRSQFNQLEIGQ